MPAEGTLLLKGQAELVRAFSRAGKDTKKYIRHELAVVAEPVAHDAENLAKENIRRIGPRWWKMRVGVTQKSVYVVPAQSGGRGPSSRRRPNFADIMQPLMDEALHDNEGRIEEAVNLALEHIEEEWAI